MACCIFQCLMDDIGWPLLSLMGTLLWVLPLSQSAGNCPQACRCSSTMNLELLVDCSDLALRTVPRSLPINTTSLNLSRNHIEVLYNYTFSDLPRLSQLDLSSNEIATIFPEAFQGLITLKILNFRNNSLCFSEIFCSMRSNVFEPLFHLEVLDIRDNFIEIQSNAFQKIRIDMTIHMICGCIY